MRALGFNINQILDEWNAAKDRQASETLEETRQRLEQEIYNTLRGNLKVPAKKAIKIVKGSKRQ